MKKQGLLNKLLVAFLLLVAMPFVPSSIFLISLHLKFPRLSSSILRKSQDWTLSMGAFD